MTVRVLTATGTSEDTYTVMLFDSYRIFRQAGNCPRSTKSAEHILTAIPRLEAPYFHIAVRKVDWGNRLLQFYCVNRSILLYSREICCRSFRHHRHHPSEPHRRPFTRFRIHPDMHPPRGPPRARARRRPPWCSGNQQVDLQLQLCTQLY